MWIIFFSVISIAFSQNVSSDLNQNETFPDEAFGIHTSVEISNNTDPVYKIIKEESVKTPFLRNNESIAAELPNVTHKWNFEEFPNPQKNPKQCGRDSPSYICDPDHVLEKEEAVELDSMVKKYKGTSYCVCEEQCTGGGLTVSIALLNYMFRPYSETLESIAESFAKGLREQWEFGTCDDDVIILVAAKDFQGSTYIGKTAEKIITKELSERIWNESKGHFLVKDYYQGLESLINSYYGEFKTAIENGAKQQFSDRNGVPAPSGQNKLTASGTFIGLILGFSILFAFAIIFSILYFRRHSYTFPKRKTSASKVNWPGEKKRTVTIRTLQSPTTKYQKCSINDINDDANKLEEGKLSKRHLSCVPEESDNEEITLPTNVPKPVERPQLPRGHTIELREDSFTE